MGAASAAPTGITSARHGRTGDIIETPIDPPDSDAPRDDPSRVNDPAPLDPPPSPLPTDDSAWQLAGEAPSGTGTSPPPAGRPLRRRALVREAVETILLATLVFLSVRASFQNFRVEGQSMDPTLDDGQFLIVNKLAYRLADPQIGDIVMLYYPVDPDKSFVKRIVAGPGDVIKSVDGRVYRNEVPLPDDFIPQEYRSMDTWGPKEVPPAHYFVMGDHRNNSSDSRS